MKNLLKTKVCFLLFSIAALTASCKDVNASQETDGSADHGATTQEIEASATDTTTVRTTTTETDLEGSDSPNQ